VHFFGMCKYTNINLFCVGCILATDFLGEYGISFKIAVCVVSILTMYALTVLSNVISCTPLDV
jgi:hypothetical protein